MAILRPLLTDAIRRMGPAEVFVGDPLTVGGMVSLGILEGERRGEIEYTENKLTMPEHTGDIAHDVISAVNVARIVCTVVLNATEDAEALWAAINPLGSNAGGGSSHVRKPTFAVALVPHSDLGKSLVYNEVTPGWERIEEDDTTTLGADAAPKHALWLWKAHVKHGSIPYGFEDGGKSRVEVTFEGMFDETKPEGAKVFLIGDPRAFATPIEVLPKV